MTKPSVTYSTNSHSKYKRNDIFIKNEANNTIQEEHADRADIVLPLIAIDGGGTNTISTIANRRGNVLSKAEASTTNHQLIGKERTVKTLSELILKNIQQLRNISPEYYSQGKTVTFKIGVFALAGIDTQRDQLIVRRIVQQVITNSNIRIEKIIVENDALSTLIGATNHTPGVLLASGTGSIAFGHDGKGNYVRSGGWGHILGDEGGGYWIGKAAIQSILKMYDGRGPKTMLSDLVLNHFGFKDHEELYDWVYGSDFTVNSVGELAKIVEEAFCLGDKVSEKILESATHELSQLAFGVIRKLNISNQPLQILFLGGVLQNNEYIKKRVERNILNKVEEIEILPNNQKPIHLILQRGLNELR
ncbi:N-acetylglucosamine kinase [Salinibacillus aidingensis]|uniref:N-acetylglucosamine kinase n=1 Tax=Salinibacillus aidingensis TaxID=237684 RepID=A0ABN1AXS7_9BACI